jgi:hypothetical protein
VKRLPSDTLRSRIRRLRIEIDELDKRALAIETCAYRDQTTSVPSRIVGFLGAFYPLAFRPPEIMEAVSARDESTRKALVRLKQAGIVEHAAHGMYRRKLEQP